MGSVPPRHRSRPDSPHRAIRAGGSSPSRSTGTTPRQTNAGREHRPSGTTSCTPRAAARCSAALFRSRRSRAAWAWRSAADGAPVSAAKVRTSRRARSLGRLGTGAAPRRVPSAPIASAEATGRSCRPSSAGTRAAMSSKDRPSPAPASSMAPMSSSIMAVSRRPGNPPFRAGRRLGPAGGRRRLPGTGTGGGACDGRARGRRGPRRLHRQGSLPPRLRPVPASRRPGLHECPPDAVRTNFEDHIRPAAVSTTPAASAKTPHGLPRSVATGSTPSTRPRARPDSGSQVSKRTVARGPARAVCPCGLGVVLRLKVRGEARQDIGQRATAGLRRVEARRRARPTPACHGRTRHSHAAARPQRRTTAPWATTRHGAADHRGHRRPPQGGGTCGRQNPQRLRARTGAANRPVPSRPIPLAGP